MSPSSPDSPACPTPQLPNQGQCCCRTGLWRPSVATGFGFDTETPQKRHRIVGYLHEKRSGRLRQTQSRFERCCQDVERRGGSSKHGADGHGGLPAPLANRLRVKLRCILRRCILPFRYGSSVETWFPLLPCQPKLNGPHGLKASVADTVRL